MPRATISSRLRFVAATTRTSTLTGSVAADALDDALLQHAQEPDLHGGRRVADLVEEDRPAVGLLEAARAAPARAGERALLVAEQLALDEPLGDARRGSPGRTAR